MKRLLSVFLLASGICWGQGTFTIPLEKADSQPAVLAHDGGTALALPSMAAIILTVCFSNCSALDQLLASSSDSPTSLKWLLRPINAQGTSVARY